MPGRSRPGSVSWSQAILNNNHSSSPSDPLAAIQEDLERFTQGDPVIFASFTDDEDENNPPNYFYGISNQEPLSPILDEDVITRTGEASRLRRRGAHHGRRHQYISTSLSCGVDLPWRFKSEGHSSGNSMEKWNSKTLPPTTSFRADINSVCAKKQLSLEFPSTGCRAVLTSSGLASTHQNVYTSTESVDSVMPVEEVYLDEEQKEIAKQVLADVTGYKEWKPVACRQCGNVVGIRYSQTFLDHNWDPLEDPHSQFTISRFVFFPSTVTSSKPFNFSERKLQSETSASRPLHLRPVAVSVVGPPSRSRRSTEPQQSEVPHQEHPFISSSGRTNAIQVRLPSGSRNESGTVSSSLQPLSLESILPSIPEGPSDAAGYVQEEDNADVSWATWMPNPYMYTSESEDGEMIQRELEQRRLRLSEAISILQTTHEEFMPNRRDTGEISDETESRPIPNDIIALPTEDTHQSSTAEPSASEESTQAPNPHPYTHLSPSAPVPPSISTRPREADRLDQHIPTYPNYLSSLGWEADNGLSHLVSEPLVTRNYYLPSPPSPTEPVDTRVSRPTLPMPSHLPISYDSPASISDIEANNRDTGEVENIGILVEVAPPPQNLTSSFGSAVVVPSLVDPSANAERRIHPTFPSNRSSFDSNERESDNGNSSSSSSSGFEIPPIQGQQGLYSTADGQYNDSDTKTDNLFSNNEIATSQVDTFDLQSANVNALREYTPSLPPLSPGALATPSLPYSPTTSVPLPPTLLPLMEILDSIEMEVLPLARYSDLEDSDSESESSDADLNAENQNSHDESVYTTELPWDCYDPDPSWLDYEGSPFESQYTWPSESTELVLPSAADEIESAEVETSD